MIWLQREFQLPPFPRGCHPISRHVLEALPELGHVKSSLLGCSLTLPIHEGRFRLAVWQGICLCEHRARASRRRLVLTLHGQQREAVGGRQ